MLDLGKHHSPPMPYLLEKWLRLMSNVNAKGLTSVVSGILLSLAAFRHTRALKHLC